MRIPSNFKLYGWQVMKGQKTGIVPFMLLLIFVPTSLFYALVIKIIDCAYKWEWLQPVDLKVPVVSVGNLTVGGTGKTPLVIYLARYFKKRGYQPVILMRGYMDKKVSSSMNSDEAKVIEAAVSNVPVLVGADRIKNARQYLTKNKVDVFILDDGFQHRKIKRDLDVVVIDATDPWGKGHLLPWGILREPFSSLKRAQSVVITKADLVVGKNESLKAVIGVINSKLKVFQSIYQLNCLVDVRSANYKDVSFIKNLAVGGFCGIGNPEAFYQTLTKLGAKVIKKFTFIDHHNYTVNDFKIMNEDLKKERVKFLITTRKDAVKIKELLKGIDIDIEVLVLDIELEMTEGKEQFLARLDSILFS